MLLSLAKQIHPREAPEIAQRIVVGRVLRSKLVLRPIPKTCPQTPLVIRARGGLPR